MTRFLDRSKLNLAVAFVWFLLIIAQVAAIGIIYYNLPAIPYAQKKRIINILAISIGSCFIAFLLYQYLTCVWSRQEASEDEGEDVADQTDQADQATNPAPAA